MTTKDRTKFLKVSFQSKHSLIIVSDSLKYSHKYTQDILSWGYSELYLLNTLNPNKDSIFLAN